MAARKLISSKQLIIVAAVFSLVFVLACGNDVVSDPTPTPSPSPGDPGTQTPGTPTPFIDFHPVLGQPFWLSPGGIAILSGDGAQIRFVRVVSDNRCPVDVTCVTGGAVTVEVAVRLSPATAEETQLWSIGPDSREPSVRSIAGIDVELLEVEPIPNTSEQPGQTRAQWLVTLTPHQPTNS